MFHHLECASNIPRATYKMAGYYQQPGELMVHQYVPDSNGEKFRQTFLPPNLVPTYWDPRTAYANHTVTPIASPQPRYTERPTYLGQQAYSIHPHIIDTTLYNPPTPGLSPCVGSSPASAKSFCSTPVNVAYPDLERLEGWEGIKKGREEDVYAEFPGAGAQPGSRPMTPGMLI